VDIGSFPLFPLMGRDERMAHFRSVIRTQYSCDNCNVVGAGELKERIRPCPNRAVIRSRQK